MQLIVEVFSPLTANIYFPAIPTLSNVFDKSTELINLTVNDNTDRKERTHSNTE